MDRRNRSWNFFFNTGTNDRFSPRVVSVSDCVPEPSGDVRVNLGGVAVGKLQRDERLRERTWTGAEGELSGDEVNSVSGRPRKDRHETSIYTKRSLFPDPDAMKAKLRAQMNKPEYHVSDFYHETGIFQCIAKSPNFEKLGLAMILLNAVWIGMDAELNTAEVISDAEWQFVLVENIFCIFFCCELLLRLGAFQRKLNCLQDGSFMFDAMLGLIMGFETWIVPLMRSGLVLGSTSGVVRMFRLVRLSRMARIARLLRTMPELLILVKGMMSAVRSVFFTLCLLGLLTYVFSITFKTLAAGTASGHEFFPSLPVAMHTLVLHGTLLDELTSLVNVLRYDAVHNGAWHLLGLLYVYVLLSALTLMNMLIGVVCEVVSAVAAAEKEGIMFGMVRDKLQHIMQSGSEGVDTDGDNLISKDEFRAMLENHEAARCLHEVGVDVIGLVDIADFIFEDSEAVDGSGEPSERLLTFGDFMEVILGLRGSNVATVKDIVDLRKYVRTSITSLRQDMSVRGQEAVDTGPPGHSEARMAELQEKLRASELRVKRLEEELRQSARKSVDRCVGSDCKARTDVACSRQGFSFDPLAALQRLSPPPPLVRLGLACGTEASCSSTGSTRADSSIRLGPACGAESSSSRGPTLMAEVPALLARCPGDDAGDGPEEGPDDGLEDGSLPEEMLSGIHVEFSGEVEKTQESTGLTAVSTYCGAFEKHSSTESAASAGVLACSSPEIAALLGRASALTGGPALCVEAACAAEVQIETSCAGDCATPACGGKVQDLHATTNASSSGPAGSVNDVVTSMKVTL